MTESRPTPAWSEMAEVGAAAGLRLLFFVHRWCGRGPFRLLLAPVVLYFYLTCPTARAASLEYWQRLAGPATWARRHWRTLRHLFAFGESLLDKTLAWSGGLALDPVRIHGWDSLAAHLNMGRGVLLLVSHLGNSEVARVLATRRPGLRLTVLVHTRHAPRFTRLLAALNADSQADLLQVTDLTAATAVALQGVIEQGGLVVIAADRVPLGASTRVTRAPFLGQEAAFPIGPYVLAALLRCPVYLLFCLRLRRGYELFLEPFAETLGLPPGRRAQALRDAAGRFASRLEHYCRRAPLQWFNFYQFWASPPSAPTAEAAASVDLANSLEATCLPPRS